MYVVMKHPRPAGLANEVPGLICLSAPEPAHAAAGAIGFPVAFADPAIFGERRADFVAPFASSVGKIVIARKLQADFVELIRSYRRS